MVSPLLRAIVIQEKIRVQNYRGNLSACDKRFQKIVVLWLLGTSKTSVHQISSENLRIDNFVVKISQNC